MHDFVPLNDESSWGFGKLPDFNALLSPHPAACFCMRYAGHSLKEEGIFNPKTASAFQELLSKGSTEDPMELYVKFRGREPKIDALLKRDGIKK